MDHKIAHGKPQEPQTVELLTRIVDQLDRIDRRVDEAAGAYLNARFPYGRPTAGSVAREPSGPYKVGHAAW